MRKSQWAHASTSRSWTFVLVTQWPQDVVYFWLNQCVFDRRRASSSIPNMWTKTRWKGNSENRKTTTHSNINRNVKFATAATAVALLLERECSHKNINKSTTRVCVCVRARCRKLTMVFPAITITQHAIHIYVNIGDRLTSRDRSKYDRIMQIGCGTCGKPMREQAEK